MPVESSSGISSTDSMTAVYLRVISTQLRLFDFSSNVTSVNSATSSLKFFIVERQNCSRVVKLLHDVEWHPLKNHKSLVEKGERVAKEVRRVVQGRGLLH